MKTSKQNEHILYVFSCCALPLLYFFFFFTFIQRKRSIRRKKMGLSIGCWERGDVFITIAMGNRRAPVLWERDTRIHKSEREGNLLLSRLKSVCIVIEGWSGMKCEGIWDTAIIGGFSAPNLSLFFFFNKKKKCGFYKYIFFLMFLFAIFNKREFLGPFV